MGLLRRVNMWHHENSNNQDVTTYMGLLRQAALGEDSNSRVITTTRHGLASASCLSAWAMGDDRVQARSRFARPMRLHHEHGLCE